MQWRIFRYTATTCKLQLSPAGKNLASSVGNLDDQIEFISVSSLTPLHPIFQHPVDTSGLFLAFTYHHTLESVSHALVSCCPPCTKVSDYRHMLEYDCMSWRSPPGNRTKQNTNSATSVNYQINLPLLSQDKQYFTGNYITLPHRLYFFKNFINVIYY
jgi:hypothetical protein